MNPLGFPAESSSPGTARADLSAIDADVRAARRHAEVVVCFFHRGTELHAAPEARQQQFAAACLQAGAQVVLGAHPHVFGSIIRPGPRMLVAWTLGNFVFPSSGLTARTGILQPHLDARGCPRLPRFCPRRSTASARRLVARSTPVSKVIHRLHIALWKC